MNNLIPIRSGQLAGDAVQTVNARNLHAFLEVETKFAVWITRRIDEYGFTENQDYVRTFPKTGKRSNVKLIDYHLSLDMAKELAMVEKTAKGREARRYFIDCERRAQAAADTAGRLLPRRAAGPVIDVAALVEAFLVERVMDAPGQRLQSARLYDVFLDWCRDRNVRALPSGIAFSKIVGRRFTRQKASRHYWLGMTLRPAHFGAHRVPTVPCLPGRPLAECCDRAADLHANVHRALWTFRRAFNEEIDQAHYALAVQYGQDSPEYSARSRILNLAHTTLNRTAEAIDKELEVMIGAARGIDGLKSLVLGEGIA